MSRHDPITDKADPWSVRVVVAQIPDTGLHRDIEAGPAIREAMAAIADLREIVSASASLDVTPKGGGRFQVAGRVRAVHDEPRRQTVASGHVAAHVDQMQPAARTQDTENLGGRSAFRVVVQMVQHHRRQHPVEFAVGVGEPLRVAAFEANPVELSCLSLSSAECERVGVGSDHRNRGMGLLGPDGEIAGTAADFQDTMAVGEFGLRDERLMDAVEAEQASQQVVAGKQRVVTGGGEVVMWIMFDHKIHTEALAYSRIS